MLHTRVPVTQGLIGRARRGRRGKEGEQEARGRGGGFKEGLSERLKRTRGDF